MGIQECLLGGRGVQDPVFSFMQCLPGALAPHSSQVVVSVYLMFPNVVSEQWCLPFLIPSYKPTVRVQRTPVDGLHILGPFGPRRQCWVFTVLLALRPLRRRGWGGGGGWEGLGKGRGVVGGKSQGNIDVFTGGKRSDFLGAHSGSLESCAFLS